MVDRVYALGLSYIQQAILARIQGDDSSSSSFQAKFFSLCETVAKDSVESAARTPEDDTFEVLTEVNNDRLRLLKLSEESTGDPDALSAIQPALKLSTASCYYISQALTRGDPPPLLESRVCSFSRALTNDSVPPFHVAIQVLRLSAKSVSGRQFQLHIVSPTDIDGAAPISSEIFPRAEDLKFSTTIKAFGKTARRLDKKMIRFQLVGHTRKLLSKPTEQVLALLEIPLSLFELKITVTRDFQMELAPDVPRDEQFLLSLCMKVRHGINGGEYEQISDEYKCCVQRAAVRQKVAAEPEVPEPVAPAMRTLQELSADERARVMAAIRAIHALEAWELERFMSLAVLKHLVDERNQLIALCEEELRIPAPKKVIAERDLFQTRKAELLAEITGKKLTIPEYRDRVKESLTQDVQLAKSKGLTAPEVAPLVERMKITKEEIDGWAK